MSLPVPDRYVDGRAMLLAGIRRRYPFAGAAPDLAGQWREFGALLPLAGQVGTTTYGVMCGASPTDFEYMCAVEVADFAALPAGLGRMRVQPQRYAVFVHQGHVSRLRAVWEGIYRQWLPQSGHQSAHKPDFEVYGQGFNTEAGSGKIEIWVAIV
jgi:AraC family transcriptional regulator